MRLLLHGNLSAAAGEALRRHGHTVLTREEAGIEPLEHAEVLKGANGKQLDIVTNDGKLPLAAFGEGSVPFGRSIIFLQLEGGDVEQDDAIDRLFARYKRLAPGRLYTVTGTRVKIRQLPGNT